MKKKQKKTPKACMHFCNRKKKMKKKLKKIFFLNFVLYCIIIVKPDTQLQIFIENNQI